jgi:hypothetical protein
MLPRCGHRVKSNLQNSIYKWLVPPINGRAISTALFAVEPYTRSQGPYKCVMETTICWDVYLYLEKGTKVLDPGS